MTDEQALQVFAVIAEKVITDAEVAAKKLRDLPLTDVGSKFPPRLLRSVREAQAAAVVLIESIVNMERIAGEVNDEVKGTVRLT